MSQNNLISIAKDGSFLAICGSNGNLKLWDTSSSILEHEFQLSEEVKQPVTCLQFSVPKDRSQSPKKNSISVVEELPSEIKIALGTLDGTLIFYIPSKLKVTKQVKCFDKSPVNSISWCSSQKLVCLGQKKFILFNINKGHKIWELPYGGDSICSLGKGRFALGGINLQFVQYSTGNEKHDHYVIPGVKTSITQLVPVYLNEEQDPSYILSAACSDRFIYAWSVKPETKQVAASFVVGDTVEKISCSDLDGNSVGIAVISRKGMLRLFINHFNGSSNVKPVIHHASLKLETSSKTEKRAVPIISAQFVSSSEILIVYGTEVFPHCERVSVKDLQGDMTWIRKDPSVFSKNKNKESLTKSVTPKVPDEAVQLLPSQVDPAEMKKSSSKRKRGSKSVHMPMEERLEALSLSRSHVEGLPKGRPLDNHVHLLIQALHSSDSAILDSILAKGEDEEVISNTVRRLPVAQVVPFLKYLQDVVLGKGVKNMACINWLKSILYHHMSYLGTMADKEELLQPLYTVLAARTSSLVTVTKLHARISLLLTHVKNRHENITQESAEERYEALLRHKEESSDDEAVQLDMDAAPSESEDMWDDWSEDENDNEEEEGHLPEEEEMKKILTKRRRVEDEEDGNFIELTDSDEEEEEETESE